MYSVWLIYDDSNKKKNTLRSLGLLRHAKSADFWSRRIILKKMKYKKPVLPCGGNEEVFSHLS